VHGPSHVAAVRTEVDRPYLPALHWPWHVATVIPVPPQVPQLQRPEHVDTVCPAAAP